MKMQASNSNDQTAGKGGKMKEGKNVVPKPEEPMQEVAALTPAVRSLTIKACVSDMLPWSECHTYDNGLPCH